MEAQQYPQEYDGYYPPVQQVRNDKASLLQEIKPNAIVEESRHKLMGEDLIDGQWQPIVDLKEKALTSVGAWDISNLMMVASSQNVAISKLRDDEIRMRVRSICRTAQRMCRKNWKRYGIKGTDQLYFVNEIVFTNTFVTLKQCQDGGIRDLLKGTTSENRLVTSEEKRKGGLSKLWESFK